MTDATRTASPDPLTDPVEAAYAAAETGDQVILAYPSHRAALSAFQQLARPRQTDSNVVRCRRTPGAQLVDFTSGGRIRFLGLNARADQLRGWSADLVTLIDPNAAAIQHASLVVLASGGRVVSAYTDRG